jgi:N-acetylneuraminic acid mutarotase
MNIPRWEARAAVVGERLYVFGGTAGYTGPYLTDAESYDPATNAWTIICPLPAAIRSFTANELNGKIYIVGGHDGSQTYDDVWEFDPSACTYTARAAMSTTRFHHAAAVLDGKIHVCGGEPAPGQDQLSSCEAYDPASDSWSPTASMSTPRDQFAMTAAGGRILAIGGGGVPPAPPVLASAEAYDPCSNTWSDIAPLPHPLIAHAAQLLDGRVFVFGGQHDEHVATSDTLWYDASSNSWLPGPAMGLARSAHAGAVINGSAYAIGGGPSGSTAAASMEALVTDCTLDVTLSYAGGTFTMDFEVGTLAPAQWNVWLTWSQNSLASMWSLPIPAVVPAVQFPIGFPLPALGTIGVLTTLTTAADGILCSDFATVNTNP